MEDDQMLIVDVGPVEAVGCCGETLTRFPLLINGEEVGEAMMWMVGLPDGKGPYGR